MTHNICKTVKKSLRKSLILSKRPMLKNGDFTIISSDCTGGMIYHELNQEFRSPTVNLFMMAKDYIRFCQDIPFWINQKMIEVQQNQYEYPVAELGWGG